GDNENIGPPHNGNFMMCLELIAEFDPFLANHLSNYGNPGKGHTSYLSHSTYEQFIKLMASKVQNKIVEEVISAQYFFIIIDSTPDIAHVDQLSFILKGQSYDNAKNMSGLYSGLQARIKEISPLADFVPCSAHSLNLVGSCAASTHNEARGLLKLMNRFEVTFMSLFWGDLLQRFNVASKYLQSVNIDVCTVCDQYESLIRYVINLRSDDMFTHYEKLALRMCKNKYETIYKRIKRRSKYHDETTNDNKINLAGSLELKVNTYFVICDSSIEELTSRKLAYDNVISKYSFFLKHTKIKSSEVRVSAEHLCSIYKKDLDVVFINECVHFQSYIQSKKNPPTTIIAMSSMLKTEELEDIYPYVSIALHMFLCTPCSNCTSERSFSTLRRIKSYENQGKGENNK
ncbi:uncharacterized protein LOC112681265, partial [Sipha flava]|uniref:Uncharacterized protein LOC112681265 n=1 Tax=Sipha flava TaxID=143950 RepID=A0A8B8F8Z8_9HEMI